jgi:UDP-3-O-[3-hydroxymyristoyl] N-acetylglucosamine deacetylase
VPATVQHLAGIQLATGLSRNEVSVETVEHLLAALTSCGVDNVLVELIRPKFRSWMAAQRRSFT